MLHQKTTNLGVRSSNLFGRANKIKRLAPEDSETGSFRVTPGATKAAFLRLCLREGVFPRSDHGERGRRTRHEF